MSIRQLLAGAEEEDEDARTLTRKLEEVQFEDTRDDRYVVFVEHLARDRLAVVDLIAQAVSRRQRHVDEPDALTGFVAFEVGVI